MHSSAGYVVTTSKGTASPMACRYCRCLASSTESSTVQGLSTFVESLHANGYQRFHFITHSMGAAVLAACIPRFHTIFHPNTVSHNSTARCTPIVPAMPNGPPFKGGFQCCDAATSSSAARQPRSMNHSMQHSMQQAAEHVRDTSGSCMIATDASCSLSKPLL